jgi:hypothetical protein
MATSKNKQTRRQKGSISSVEERTQFAADKHFTAFYSWVKTIITLSSGALTLLVGFQKNYVSEAAKYIYILKASWILLLLTIILGVIVLFGESETMYDAWRILDTEKPRKPFNIAPKLYIRVAQRLLPFCFVAALFCVTFFAIAN